ncbi:hypothetical protein V2G26_008318 [Clonostachys chloroleuca]|uniref:MARVEL domain-containing protein n=1 Tax=Clonostachys chloroleuca TaxID=1926264 RepID=A0AA35QEA0_9HYPO|nr:unnamed protein product [Clonostachys chloroleuca]
MGAKGGIALKFLQWFIRGVQLLASALILGVYAYFLAALHNHDLNITNQVRAVAGISGAGVLYSIIGLLLLCCLAGIMITSAIAIVLDVAFIGAFIYVAVANKNGASSCTGYLDTPFGKGQSSSKANGSDGFTALPSFHTACRLQSACLGVAIIAIIFFVLSILTEVALARHHNKEKRFGPGPNNNYTTGYGSGGLFNRIFRRGTKRAGPEENALPAHTTPEQLDHTRQSYATETTAVHSNEHNPYSADYPKQETGYGYPTTQNAGVGHQTTTAATPQNYRYGDGVYDRV